MISLDRSYWIYFFVPWVALVSCNQDNLKPNRDFSNEGQSTINETVPNINSDTALESVGLDTLFKGDSIVVNQPDTLGPSVKAYGNLFFGMHPDQVVQSNDARQKLASYYYHFDYSYNNNKELYAIYLRSDPEMAIYYETRLQNKYTNLCRIITEKYGGKNKCGILPSIFEVMNNKTMYLSKWQNEGKKIQMGIQQTDLNAYTVICKISNPEMEIQAKKEKYIKDNKKWIDASKKF